MKASADELRALLHRRPAGKIAGMSAKGDSPTIRSEPSAARAWWRFRGLQELLRYICENGFEHHVAANFRHCCGAVYEATTVTGWRCTGTRTDRAAEA